MASGRGQHQQDDTTDTFLERMKDQCREIKQYRLDVIREQGRCLSQDEAALEWIARYAESFARDHDST